MWRVMENKFAQVLNQITAEVEDGKMDWQWQWDELGLQAGLVEKLI